MMTFAEEMLNVAKSSSLQLGDEFFFFLKEKEADE